MADRALHPAVVRRAILVALVTLAGVAAPALAHNQHEGAYRKWPWKAGRDRPLTTLPGECPHCPGVQSSSAWKAIDADMNYETVYSISSGTLERYEPGAGAAGKYIRVADDDGTYVVYEHLSQALVTTRGRRITAGQAIAVSGCTGNCSGAHLHFQRNDAVGFNSNALPLVRISGHGGSADPLAETTYASDNAGIGSTVEGAVLGSMQDAYQAAGGYDRVGATADVGGRWSPCRSRGATGTWWRYRCDPREGIEGGVQTFLGPGESPRAIMHERGTTRSYVLWRGILGAYTELMGGQDWSYHLGYPTSNRTKLADGLYVQEFQRGAIYYNTTCREDMFIGSRFWGSYFFCD